MKVDQKALHADPAVKAAQKVLDRQECWHCKNTGARYVLYVKTGEPVLGAEYMSVAKLLTVGFKEVGFVHSNDKGGRGTCFQELSKDAPGMGLQLTFRDSDALIAYNQAIAAAEDRIVAARRRQARVGASLSALADIARATQVSDDPLSSVDEVIETKPADAPMIPVAEVVPDETPATTEQVASSAFGSLMGFVKKAVEG